MPDLTNDQSNFLKINQIPLSAIYDASGLRRAEYSSVMKELGKWVAIGVTPCKKHGHTMRTRKGHCMQCSPLAHVFLKRHIDVGEVYIAGSKQGKFLKIGTTNNHANREATLNSYGYGGVNDWQMIIAFQAKNAGLVEYEAQKIIHHFSYPAKYKKDGRVIDCLEIFRCRYSRAKNSLIKNLNYTKTPIFCSNELEFYFEKIGEQSGNFERKGNDRSNTAKKLETSKSIASLDFKNQKLKTEFITPTNIKVKNSPEKNKNSLIIFSLIMLIILILI